MSIEFDEMAKQRENPSDEAQSKFIFFVIIAEVWWRLLIFFKGHSPFFFQKNSYP